VTRRKRTAGAALTLATLLATAAQLYSGDAPAPLSDAPTTLLAAPTTLPAPAPTTGPTALIAPFKPAFAAMTYYDQSCAKCHGPQGSFYGPTLGNDLTDAQLSTKIQAMSAGPANSPLAADENPVVTAYHRSLITRTPFVSITDTTPGAWAGEVTPGAAVTLLLPAGRRIAASVEDWNWTANIPAGTAPQAVTLEARVGAQRVDLRLADYPYDCTAPLPPPHQRRK
jgi:hypothetical protein